MADTLSVLVIEEIYCSVERPLQGEVRTHVSANTHLSHTVIMCTIHALITHLFNTEL